MARQIVTTRLTEAQAATLKQYAERHGITFYRATAHALERGIAAMIGAPEIDASAAIGTSIPNAVEDAIGTLQAQADRGERFARQALYAAGAAYAASVAIAKATLSAEEARVFDARVSDEAARIFERQAAKALED